jgi:hypothetical protein
MEEAGVQRQNEKRVYRYSRLFIFLPDSISYILPSLLSPFRSVLSLFFSPVVHHPPLHHRHHNLPFHLPLTKRGVLTL